MNPQLHLMIMSGVEDGRLLTFASDEGEGLHEGGDWIIRLGRREDNDFRLEHDTFTSRYHARLIWRAERWWLQDLDSKNGSYLEAEIGEDARINGTIPLRVGQLFRVGRTWLRIQPLD